MRRNSPPQALESHLDAMLILVALYMRRKGVKRSNSAIPR
jgi:hypothetical protein